MVVVTILYSVYTAVILLGLITAITFRKSLKTRMLSILIIFLLVTFIQESILYLYRHYIPQHSNVVVYNIYRPFSTIIFAILYSRIPIMKPMKRIIISIAGFYLLANAVVYLFIHSIFEFNGYLGLLRGLFITSFAIFFLFRYFHLDDPEKENFWKPVVWISTGIVLFYPASSISLVFQKYLSEFTIIVAGFKLHQLIPQVLSIFMYSCFSYAFYLCKKIA